MRDSEIRLRRVTAIDRQHATSIPLLSHCPANAGARCANRQAASAVAAANARLMTAAGCVVAAVGDREASADGLQRGQDHRVSMVWWLTQQMPRRAARDPIALLSACKIDFKSREDTMRDVRVPDSEMMRNIDATDPQTSSRPESRSPVVNTAGLNSAMFDGLGIDVLGAVRPEPRVRYSTDGRHPSI